MKKEEPDVYLRTFDPIEQIQLKTRQNVNDFDGNELLVEDNSGIPRMQSDYFFKHGPVFINKHHRFADMPLHKHSFIEINYMYAGQCRQQINGQEIILSKGQVCLLDTDVPHSLSALGEEDILINIIMMRETFSAAFWSHFKEKGLVAEFLLNALSENQRHDRYILFHSENNKDLHLLAEKMASEFFKQDSYSLGIVQALLPAMFMELMRVYQLDKNYKSEGQNGKANVIDILQYIEQHYQNCTLTSLAEEFNFNANYLGNMLRERTGKTFLELVQMQRMIQASILLKNTNRNVDEIAYEVGYESSSFFHRKFKQYFGMTPFQFRKKRS